MSQDLKWTECRRERLARECGYELVHDGRAQPNHPVQGGIFDPSEKRFFTRIYRREVDGKFEELVFRYDRRSGKGVLYDVRVRRRNCVERRRQGVIQGNDTRIRGT
jgi:hypothetical protein